MARKSVVTGALLVGLLFLAPKPAQAMHIMEGFLPLKWALVWTGASLPFVVWGTRTISCRIAGDPQLKLLLGVAGAFAFIVSALKLPSVTGSSSHATGVGLGVVLFGPAVMSVVGCIVLLFQALFLAHGGLTTLGANTFSMAIVGPFAAVLAYRLAKKIGLPLAGAVFVAAFTADILTYITTSVQLALAFPSPGGGVAASFVKFAGTYALTQLPLAVGEGLLTVIVFNYLSDSSRAELVSLNIIEKGMGKS